MEKASIVIGEVNSLVPRTMGNTFVHVDDFDYLVRATEPPIYFPRWPVDDVIDKVAANVASIVEDGSCISFYSGALFEALGRHLARKRNLGIHTYFFTDPLMDLIKCGAVTNRKKNYFRDKSLTAYAQGTPELMKWLHRNPLVEFQGIDVVSDHLRISLNDRMIAILPARKVDLTGGIALHIGKGNVTPGRGSPGILRRGGALPGRQDDLRPAQPQPQGAVQHPAVGGGFPQPVHQPGIPGPDHHRIRDRLDDRTHRP
jgi:acyl-CoA hydrolase